MNMLNEEITSTNLQIRSKINLSDLSTEEFDRLMEAFDTIDQIADKHGSMKFVPTGFRQNSGVGSLRRTLKVVLGWAAFY